jgi:hypothetical protein
MANTGEGGGIDDANDTDDTDDTDSLDADAIDDVNDVLYSDSTIAVSDDGNKLPTESEEDPFVVVSNGMTVATGILRYSSAEMFKYLFGFALSLYM